MGPSPSELEYFKSGSYNCPTCESFVLELEKATRKIHELEGQNYTLKEKARRLSLALDAAMSTDPASTAVANNLKNAAIALKHLEESINDLIAEVSQKTGVSNPFPKVRTALDSAKLRVNWLSVDEAEEKK